MAIGNLITTIEAAAVLGVNDSRVRQFARDKRLKPAKKIGTNLLFERRDVLAFKRKPRKNGRPKKT